MRPIIISWQGFLTLHGLNWGAWHERFAQFYPHCSFIVCQNYLCKQYIYSSVYHYKKLQRINLQLPKYVSICLHTCIYLWISRDHLFSFRRTDEQLAVTFLSFYLTTNPNIVQQLYISNWLFLRYTISVEVMERLVDFCLGHESRDQKFVWY